jgi:ribonuclease D
MDFKLINADRQLAELRNHFYNSNIAKIAMDFEADFGTYSYGNKLCLIQIYDGKLFYIIDPYKISKDEMIKFLADKRTIKYMYGVGSDIKLIYDQYKIKVQGVYDLQLLVDVVNNHHQRWWLEWVAPIRGLKPSIILSFSTYS